MQTREQLLEVKKILTSDCIDDVSEWLLWLVEEVPELIDEVLSYRDNC